MTNRTDPNHYRELGRLGGLASAAARRKRRDRGWFDSFLESVDAEPAEFAAGLLASGNAMAKVEALKIAQEAKTAQLRAREADLDKREKELAAREREVATWEPWVQAMRAEHERIEAEVLELERSRDELLAAIEREADAHDFELLEVDEDATVEA